MELRATVNQRGFNNTLSFFKERNYFSSAAPNALMVVDQLIIKKNSHGLRWLDAIKAGDFDTISHN